MREHRVKQSTDGLWFVAAPDGQVIAHGLTNADAWRAADKQNGEADAPRQIRDASTKPVADFPEAIPEPSDAA